jgi:hypothetical protein
LQCHKPQIENKSEKQRNICYRGALIPGIRQIYLYQFLISS